MIKIGKFTTSLLYDDPFVTKIFNLHFVTLRRRKEFLGVYKVFIITIIRDWPNKYPHARETQNQLVSNYHVNMFRKFTEYKRVIHMHKWMKT